MPREIFAHLNTKSWTALCAVVWLGFLAIPATAQSPLLPQKQTPRPETTNGVPHVQIGITPDPKLSQALLKVVAEFPGVQIGPTRVSLPGAIGFQLLDEVSLAQPKAIVGGREFAHLHPDGSLHASLDLPVAQQAISRGWAVAHPWATRRRGWEGFVMIYTPNNQTELKTVIQLVKESYGFVTGQMLPN